ncbi:MAG: hypothetical protein K6E47_05675 [Lachnospiraceae bacterium]|nr:hypothetical protein [Lachnospiraceae bacterium]
MPTRVEEICKQIHILFAKGETYQNSPDLVILSKTELFALLQELNEAMYEVLDQYEATTRAKEKAILETEREASEIIAKAKVGAEDVQAVSLTYADTMIDEINGLIENTKQSIRSQYLEFLAAMDEKQESLKENRDQLKEQLQELRDSDTYTQLLDDIRNGRTHTVEEAKSADNDKKDSKKDSSDEFPPAPKAPEPVIRVNRPGENPGVTFTTRRSHNKKNKQINVGQSGSKPVIQDQEPVEGQVFSAEDFDLDGEYEQFKQEQEAAKNKNNPKKGSFKLFGKKKK